MEGILSAAPGCDIITPQSNPTAYKDLTTFWAAQNNRGPQAIVVPRDTKSLAKAIRYLYNDTELGFTFRGHGYASLPTKDILLSLHKFDSFTYNSEEMTITVGAGQHWLTVYEALHQAAPRFTGMYFTNLVL